VRITFTIVQTTWDVQTRVKRNDFDANYRPESLHESSRLAEKTRIVVMTMKEP